MKIKELLYLKIALIFGCSLLTFMPIMGAEVEHYFSKETVAVFNKADEHKNYCVRYFHRKIEGRDDLVVLMGEKHIKEDKDEADRGLEVVKQFSCIGCEDGTHFTNSGLSRFDWGMNYVRKMMSNADAQRLGSTMFDYSEYLENILALGLCKAVEEFFNANESEKKTLFTYINFDPEHAPKILLGGIFGKYLKSRGFDGQTLNDPINVESLKYWLTALGKRPNFLTSENADRVEQAITQIRHGKKNLSYRALQSQNEPKLGTRIDLEKGCTASFRDNIYSAINTVWTFCEFLTIPAFATWCMTGSSYAGAYTGIGLCLIGFDKSCALLNKIGFLEARYCRYFYSLGVDTRDSVMAHNINEFFDKQNDSQQFLAIMGKLHVPGVARHLLNTYGFREIKAKEL